MQSEMDHCWDNNHGLIAKSEMELLSLDCLEESRRLSLIRQKRIDNGTLVESELSQLGMPHCRFRVNTRIQRCRRFSRVCRGGYD